MARSGSKTSRKTNGSAVGNKESRSAKLADTPSASFEQLWKRMDALYDDCATELIDVPRASTLSRIAGRQLTLLGMAIAYQRRNEQAKRLLPTGRLPLAKP